MANVFGTLINAVNTATSPDTRNAAVNALSSAITDVANRGGDIRAMFADALGANPAAVPGVALGPAGLQAIGDVQRYLANVASGGVVPTPEAVSAIIAQLVNVLGGIGFNIPGLPGLPQLPGLTIQIPQIPGLDPCRFLKCLAASMDCSCGQSGGGAMPGTDGKGDDPIGTMVGGGIEILKRARDMADEKLRQADQVLQDLGVAAKVATGAAKAGIEAARKEAEAKAKDLRAKSEQLGQTIGGAIANGFPGR